jgi:hypothetical protein
MVPDASDLWDSMAENGQFKDRSCDACNLLRDGERIVVELDGAVLALEHTCGK